MDDPGSPGGGVAGELIVPGCDAMHPPWIHWMGAHRELTSYFGGIQELVAEMEAGVEYSIDGRCVMDLQMSAILIS